MLEFFTDPTGDILNSIYKDTFRFQQPELLWLIPIAAVILILILVKSFVKIDKKRLGDIAWVKSRRRYRITMFISRMIIFSLLFIALADPFGEVKK
ncbi:TPA: hypothetical protein HA265_02840, partial [Candidatus Woesearchaeota archaeon]|nr:hypothetical protein [Candidatus Woesearchaeota archaeon]